MALLLHADAERGGDGGVVAPEIVMGIAQREAVLRWIAEVVRRQLHVASAESGRERR